MTIIEHMFNYFHTLSSLSISLFTDRSNVVDNVDNDDDDVILVFIFHKTHFSLLSFRSMITLKTSVCYCSCMVICRRLVSFDNWRIISLSHSYSNDD